MGSEVKNNQPKKERKRQKLLGEKQMKCIQLLLSGELNHTEIAKELKISRNTIYKWKKDPLFVAELQKCADDIKSRTQRYLDYRSLEAAKALWGMATSDAATLSKTRASIYNEWLDRTMGKPTTSVTVEHKQDEANETSLKEMLAAVKERLDREKA